jgi:hypothetical protein
MRYNNLPESSIDPTYVYDIDRIRQVRVLKGILQDTNLRVINGGIALESQIKIRGDPCYAVSSAPEHPYLHVRW